MNHTTSPARLAVTNAKGGTGKTTVAINIAGALNRRGREVLLVDLDPQGNATEGLGFLEEYNRKPPTLFDVITDPGQRSAVSDLVVRHPEMDLLPSNVDMLHAEHELTIADLMAKAQSDPSAETVQSTLESLAVNVTADAVTGQHAFDLVERGIAALDTEYDYVVIDSPPFYGNLTNAGIYTARNVVIPALTEASSERAVELLLDQIAALERQTGVNVADRGVVANRVESTGEDRTMLDWFNVAFPDVPVWEVRKRVALQRAFSDGVSIFEYDETVDMEDAFLAIADHLDRQFGFAEADP